MTQEENKTLLLFESFFNSGVVGTAINAPDGKWLHVNDRLCEMLGCAREELLRSTWQDFTPPEDLKSELPRFNAVFGKKVPVPFEKKYRRKDGTLIDVLLSTSIVANPDGSIAQFCSIFQDITERKRMEDALRKSELQYRSLIESSSAVIFCVDEKGAYQFTNTIFAGTFGKTPDYFIGKTFWDIYPKDLADMRFEVTKRVFETGRTESVEVEVPLPDRTLYYYATANPIKDDTGKVILNLTYATDITARRLAEDKVKGLLVEKELVLAEVHHRIKNNMNTISSLLSLQAGMLSDPSAIGVLEDARNRVQSMMVLYDKLYLSPNYSEISTAQYLPALVEEIVANFPNRKDVTIETRIDDFILRVGKIQPLGMIINELLTNTMKYAFGGGTGTITVEASLNGGRVRIVIGDDGKGIPESVNFGNSTGFGLTLVYGLVKQLKGDVRIERNGGTRIVLEFDK